MIVLNKIKTIATSLENSKAPFIYFIATFFFATNLRNFLESFSSPTFGYSVLCFGHSYISYISMALTIIILFHFATRERVERVSRVVLPCFLIINLAPIIDLLVSSGRGCVTHYLIPGVHDDLLLRFFTFFGSFQGKGVTPGIRIEIALVILASFSYFLIKNKNIIRSLIFAFLMYVLLFSYASMPFIAKGIINIFRLNSDLRKFPIIHFYLFMIFIWGVWLSYLYSKKYFIEIIKDIRPFRLLHFELMFLLGAVLAGIYSPNPIQLTQHTFFPWIFIMLAIVFACLFSIITNNLADRHIDKIVNKSRPSVTLAIPMPEYKRLAFVFFLLAIAYSAIAGFSSLFLIVLFMGNYFLYSMPPVRMKRVTFLSKILISVNSLALVLVGYMFLAKKFHLPFGIAFFFLTCFTAAVNFIDIKDYEGDKKGGIKTLPTILGLGKSKKIIGVFFLIAYIAVFFMLGNIYLLPVLFILGIFQFFLINRKNYNEKPVFIVYLLSVAMLIVYLMEFFKV